MAKLTEEQLRKMQVPNQKIIICRESKASGAYGIIYRDDLKIACTMLRKSAPALTLYLVLATNTDGYMTTSGAHHFKEYGIDKSSYKRGIDILKTLNFITNDEKQKDVFHFWRVPQKYESIQIIEMQSADGTPCVAHEHPYTADGTPCVAHDEENNTINNTNNIINNNNSGSLDKERFREYYNKLINNTLPEDATEREIVQSILGKYKIEHKSLSRFIDKYGAWVNGWDADTQQPRIVLSMYYLPESVISGYKHNTDGIPESYYTTEAVPEEDIETLIKDLGSEMGWYEEKPEHTTAKRKALFDYESGEIDDFEPEWDGSLPF